MGVRIVHAGGNSDAIDEDGWVYGGRVLVETFIPGRELTVAVMGDRALGVTEITTTTAFFDYTAKYTSGHATHVCPAQIPADIEAEVKRLAVLAHETLGCSGVSRSDFRWDDSKAGTGGIYFLEINNQPGMTPISLVPEQAGHAGISYPDLCAWIVEQARCHA